MTNLYAWASVAAKLGAPRLFCTASVSKCLDSCAVSIQVVAPNGIDELSRLVPQSSGLSFMYKLGKGVGA